MADEKSSLETWSSALKDLVSTLRDGVFFVLFLLLLLSPGTVKNRLIAAGFTKGNIGGMEWEGQIKQSAEQTKAVGEVVSKADENYKVLIDRLAELEKSVRDPTVKQSLTSLGADAKVSQGELLVADKAVKRSLSTQQAIVEAVTPSSISDRGWLFLGKVNEPKEQWLPGSPVTVAVVSPIISRGTKLTIRDDTYWRADSAAGQHANASILSVAKVGTVVNVDDVDYSHARGGGWFVWIRAHSET
jgi:hypothetical protein